MEKEIYLNELAAIWMGKGCNLEGSCRVQPGDFVAIKNGRFVKAEYATHKVLGAYGDQWSNDVHLMLWDVVECQVYLINLI